MFESYIPQEGDDGLQSPMSLALTAISSLLRLRIRTVAESKTGKRNGVGVLLFGCNPLRGIRKKSNSDTEDDEGDNGDEKLLPSTHELIALKPPGIDEVEWIQSCLSRDLKKEFSGDVVERGEEEDGGRSLREALHEASKVFMHAKYVY
jgi:hypothetical protein